MKKGPQRDWAERAAHATQTEVRHGGSVRNRHHFVYVLVPREEFKYGEQVLVTVQKLGGAGRDRSEG